MKASASSMCYDKLLNMASYQSRAGGRQEPEIQQQAVHLRILPLNEEACPTV